MEKKNLCETTHHAWDDPFGTRILGNLQMLQIEKPVFGSRFLHP
jgi:hypothetical protein